MSRIDETRQAYERLSMLLDQEVRNKKADAKKLERFRETMNVAFYLLGWAQFEYLIRSEAKAIIDVNARQKALNGHAWSFMQENLKAVKLRQKLDIVFSANEEVRKRLKGDYELRNDAAHGNKKLPPEARDLVQWLVHLEDLVANL